MDVSVSAATFSSFLKCPRKGYFLLRNISAPSALFSDMEARLFALYKAEATGQHGDRLPVLTNFRDVTRASLATVHGIDCATAVYRFGGQASRYDGARDRSSAHTEGPIPVMFSPWDKADLIDSMLVCFGAIALAQVSDIWVSAGMLIYGTGYRRKLVQTDQHVARLYPLLEAMRKAHEAGVAPPVVLNRHCSTCDFQSQCRQLAIDHDDLTLLRGMTEKERSKIKRKGISTITQLSYSYRPRRRRRKRSVDGILTSGPGRPATVARNNQALRALAIKKQQAHIQGAPSLRIEGTPVVLDVEGMPDRDFYYLIGLRFSDGNKQVQKSFWANGPDGERDIWQQCLRMLQLINKPQIVSYGAYELRFLRRMKSRYIGADRYVEGLLATAINLVDCLYGKIYLPTYSNSLKEIGRYLGIEWTWLQGSGSAAPLMRRTWELGGDERFKQDLIAYNVDDCRAAEKVMQTVAQICQGASPLNIVDVRSLEVGFQHPIGKFDSALPDFEKINGAAYWDYQRTKVYVRTSKTIRKSVSARSLPQASGSVDRHVVIEDAPAECRRCGANQFWAYNRDSSHIIYDLKFTRRGIKRATVQYHYGKHMCSACRCEMTMYQPPSQYGPNLRAFLVYLVIELRLSYRKACDHVLSLFDVRVPTSIAQEIKSEFASRFQPTYNYILRELANGPLIHADETRGVVNGGGHYVWVFTNLTSVAYVYAKSRDRTVLDELLAGFKGVLVSDFYAAYDGVPCPQQKCLIHLMRDINEDLHKNPFDESLKDIATQFGVLLRDIVATIDMHGLKAWHMRKHTKDAERFLEHVRALKCEAEAGVALQKRIEKNEDKLFTFLHYDGVPWNNNNAEHAVRAFTRLRNVIGTSTPKGHRDYATLLSIQQTLHYRGRGLLDFLRSGRVEIE